MDIDFARITRLEVIEEAGRVYARWNMTVEPSVQDDGRTLKLFCSQLRRDRVERINLCPDHTQDATESSAAVPNTTTARG